MLQNQLMGFNLGGQETKILAIKSKLNLIQLPSLISINYPEIP